VWAAPAIESLHRAEAVCECWGGGVSVNQRAVWDAEDVRSVVSTSCHITLCVCVSDVLTGACCMSTLLWCLLHSSALLWAPGGGVGSKRMGGYSLGCASGGTWKNMPPVLAGMPAARAILHQRAGSAAGFRCLQALNTAKDSDADGGWDPPGYLNMGILDCIVPHLNAHPELACTWHTPGCWMRLVRPATCIQGHFTASCLHGGGLCRRAHATTTCFFTTSKAVQTVPTRHRPSAHNEQPALFSPGCVSTLPQLAVICWDSQPPGRETPNAPASTAQQRAYCR
jgi:hypothetical protein